MSSEETSGFLKSNLKKVYQFIVPSKATPTTLAINALRLGIMVGIWIGWWRETNRTAGDKLERDGIGFLNQVITKWRPINCESEKDYQNSLYTYLLGRFSEDQLSIETEYGHKNSKIDIVIGDQWPIELKEGLEGQSEIKRLKGQMKMMQKKFGCGLIVLCGQTPEGVVKTLKSDYGSEKTGGFFPIKLDVIEAQDAH